MMLGVTIHLQDRLSVEAGKDVKAVRIGVVLCVAFAPLMYVLAVLFTVLWVLPAGKWEKYHKQAGSDGARSFGQP